MNLRTKTLLAGMGITELIQGDDDTKYLYLKNCEQYKNKIKAFKETKLCVLYNKFDEDAIIKIVKISNSINLNDLLIDGKSKIAKQLKYLYERLLRDYMSYDWVAMFTYVINDKLRGVLDERVICSKVKCYLIEHYNLRTHHIARECEKYLDSLGGDSEYWKPKMELHQEI